MFIREECMFSNCSTITALRGCVCFGSVSLRPLSSDGYTVCLCLLIFQLIIKLQIDCFRRRSFV